MTKKVNKKQKEQFLKAFSKKKGEEIVAIASDETVDRQGDSLPINKWNWSNYLKNPVIQFGHDYSSFPIGKAKKIWIENSQLKFIPEFHNITDEAKQASKLTKAGYLNAWSVGFLPHMLANEEGVEDIESLELLEISLVPVPANPRALIEARAKGFKTDKIDKLFKDVKKKVVKKSEEEEDEKDDDCGCGKDVKVVKKEVKKVEKTEKKVAKKVEKKIEKKEKPKKEVKTEKAGRVISEKNRGKIKTTVESIAKSLTSLKGSLELLEGLLVISEPKEKKIKKSKKLDKPQVATAKKEQKRKTTKTVAKKSRTPKVNKLSDNQMIALALKKIARNAGYAIQKMAKSTSAKQG